MIKYNSPLPLIFSDNSYRVPERDVRYKKCFIDIKNIFLKNYNLYSSSFKSLLENLN